MPNPSNLASAIDPSSFNMPVQQATAMPFRAGSSVLILGGRSLHAVDDEVIERSATLFQGESE
jgi:hypothetical protein